MFAPGGGLTKSQVCFALKVSILTCIGTFHRSRSVVMACLYDCGIWCEAFVLVKHVIMFSCSLGQSIVTAIDPLERLPLIAHSCPSPFPVISRLWYSLGWMLALDGWGTHVDQRGSMGLWLI